MRTGTARRSGAKPIEARGCECGCFLTRELEFFSHPFDAFAVIGKLSASFSTRELIDCAPYYLSSVDIVNPCVFSYL